MQHIVHYLDMLLAVTVLLVSCDYLRIVYFFDEPAISIAFLVTAGGSFGLTLYLFNGGTPPAWALMLHTSIAIFTAKAYGHAVRRGHLYQMHWLE